MKLISGLSDGTVDIRDSMLGVKLSNFKAHEEGITGLEILS